ncbi:hypothetical protein COL516b_003689 [Colletotrichum fioriniae]|nr:uncharacterized protein COL516b_003689 [Colletotrichum fioriniae]KAJ0308420.1 hypothetical protein COL516b_003689 [Colletotrichum fioriniae]
MGDKHLNELLKWSIENQETGGENGTSPPADATAARAPASTLNPEAIAALFGNGPSDAELMKLSMEAITSPDPEITLDNKLIAFDNFEQLIENLDNANNIANLGLWTPLLSCLEHEAHELRRMAACQERLLAVGGIPPLVALATKDGEEEAVRRKAVYALSSAVRNYQPGADVLTDELQKKGLRNGKVDAENMDDIDEIMNALKAKITA